MLQSTANLLYETHMFFDEIGYRPKKGMINHKRVNEQVMWTLNHAKTAEDAQVLLEFYLQYLKRMNKIIRKAAKYPELWDLLEWEGSSVISTVKDKDAEGTYYLTNIYDGDSDKITISTQTLGDKPYKTEKTKGYYAFGRYFLRFSRLSSKKMVLEDNEGNKLATIVMDKEGDINLLNNETDYELIKYDIGTAFYRKTYLNALGKKKPNLDECKGFMQWDIIDDDGNYGLSLLEYYDLKDDLDLMCAIAASPILIFKNFVKVSYIPLILSLGLANSLRYRPRIR